MDFSKKMNYLLLSTFYYIWPVRIYKSLRKIIQCVCVCVCVCVGGAVYSSNYQCSWILYSHIMRMRTWAFSACALSLLSVLSQIHLRPILSTKEQVFDRSGYCRLSLLLWNKHQGLTQKIKTFQLPNMFCRHLSKQRFFLGGLVFVLFTYFIL